MEEQVPILKPNNNMALAIITTVCCCLPFGIVAIIKANSVDSLYMMKQYSVGIVLSLVFWILYFLFFGGLALLGGSFFM